MWTAGPISCGALPQVMMWYKKVLALVHGPQTQKLNRSVSHDLWLGHKIQDPQLRGKEG